MTERRKFLCIALISLIYLMPPGPLESAGPSWALNFERFCANIHVRLNRI